MPRKPRPHNIVPGLPNHIVHRGNNRRRLFSYPTDFRTMLRLIGEASRDRDCEINALCLMPNHLHDLSTPPSIDAASTCVANFAQRWAQRRNTKRNGSGKLFEGRFYSKPVKSEHQLAATTVYVEANPIRAGIVSDPLDYPWSTYALHAGYIDRSKIPPDMWTPSPWYLSLGPDSDTRARAYRELFANYVARGKRPDHADEVNRIEALASSPDTRHLRRPDGTRAAEPAPEDWTFVPRS